MKRGFILGLILLFLIIVSLIQFNITGYTILPQSENLRNEPIETPPYIESIYCKDQECNLKFVGEVSYIYTADTGSMSPLFNGDRVIVIKPNSENGIDINSIIIFYDKESENPTDLIIHRVVKIGTDEVGWYCITKGDNVETEDNLKVRFGDIKWIAAGVVW